MVCSRRDNSVLRNRTAVDLLWSSAVSVSARENAVTLHEKFPIHHLCKGKLFYKDARGGVIVLDMSCDTSSPHLFKLRGH